MKTFSFLLFVAFACLPVHANTPKKEPLVKYTGLWTNSPFTSKPPIVGPGATVNPFEDYTLTGIAPVPGGYRITIMSKKNPEVRKVIEPGRNSEFKVVSVNRNAQKSLGTTVVLSSGAIRGTVSFEPDLITVKAAHVAPVAPNPNQPPGVSEPNQPPQPPQTGPNAQRQPRPRIVAPPAPTAQPLPQQQQPQNQSGGRGEENRRENRRR